MTLGAQVCFYCWCLCAALDVEMAFSRARLGAIAGVDGAWSMLGLAGLSLLIALSFFPRRCKK